MGLKAAISQKISTINKAELKAAFEYVSNAYRSQQAQRVTSGKASMLLWAYVAARMPATYAVVERVLNEYVEIGGKAPRSVLDIGAGPGTASFAIADLFDNVSFHLVEKELGFRDVALELATLADTKPILNAQWVVSDAKSTTFPKSDLAIASYSLGELQPDDAISLAKTVFAKVDTFIVVEPGTPQGFGTVRAIRDALIASGATVVAPCPHQAGCPMIGADFCHFSERLQREDYHRDAKNASLPYEDEKFAYAIFVKRPLASYAARIVKRPMKGSGHVTLDLCTDGKIERRVVARSNKALYKIARKSEWGDRYDHV